MSFASLRLGPRVPAARAPHARPPPCYLRLARVMKAPPRPLSQKRAAEGLQGRVRRARVYVLSPAAGAARRSTPLPLRGPRASLERFTHYSDGFYGVFLPENAQNPCCSVAVKKESIPSAIVNIFLGGNRGKSREFAFPKIGKRIGERIGKRARAAPCCARCTPRAALTRRASHEAAPRPCAQHHSACAGPRRRAAHRVPILKN